MPRAPNAILAFVTLAACGGDAVAPTPAAIRQADTPPTVASIAPVASAAMAQAIVKSNTAGLDDALARLIPPLGSAGVSLRAPLSLLRDDLKVTNSSARMALLTVANAALDRVESSASATHLADLSAIRFALDAVRVDDGAGK